MRSPEKGSSLFREFYMLLYEGVYIMKVYEVVRMECYYEMKELDSLGFFANKEVAEEIAERCRKYSVAAIYGCETYVVKEKDMSNELEVSNEDNPFLNQLEREYVYAKREGLV